MDNSQIENMRKLFANAGHANSDGNMTFPLRAIRHERTTKWVCEECYQLLPHAEEIVVDHLVSLEEYADLSSRVEEVEVTLRCSASVNIFKKSVENNSKLRKAVIHIKSGYFYTPERRQGSQYATIKNQFNELGKALKDRSLTRIEIRGDGYEDRSEGYENRESVFAGLQRVFKCSDLRSIFISGMPDFLRGADIPINACKLELIVLDQVYINTAETANNLIRLLASNSVLKQLRLSNSQLTLTAMTVLERNERARESFKKLSRLYISHNSFGLSTAVTLVAMALQGNCLTHLDISHCPGVRDAGCSEIVEKLRLYRTGRRLEVIATDGTGISAETEAKMDCFRIRSKFTE
ncbi:hypothetical protein BGX31_004246 [Mortierella sp. GBA43]|nr:hypothetical protein BGX31_004246 [Mortierella sp. GBA43]